MRALHLPAVPSGANPPFHFPGKPPSPSDLRYTSEAYPDPIPSPSLSQQAYLIRVLTTAVTRGELTWQEILEPSRFHSYGSAIPGHDVVGIVVKAFQCETGSAPKYCIGERVWGLLDFDRDGAAATFAIAFESELTLTPAAPSNTPSQAWDETLATLPLSGLTAYQALFVHGELPSTTLLNPSAQAGPRRLLITGSAGSVGVPTIQLAKAAGFQVIAVCSASSQPLVEALLTHDDDTIDYTTPEYVSIPAAFQRQKLAPVDLVVDCTGGSTLQSILLSPSVVVKPGGRVITIVAPIHTFGSNLSAQILRACTAAKVLVDFFIVKPSGSDLEILAALVRQGRLQGCVDAVFELEKGREAMELVGSRGRRAGGKVVLRVAE